MHGIFFSQKKKKKNVTVKVLLINEDIAVCRITVVTLPKLTFKASILFKILFHVIQNMERYIHNIHPPCKSKTIFLHSLKRHRRVIAVSLVSREKFHLLVCQYSALPEMCPNGIYFVFLFFFVYFQHGKIQIRPNSPNTGKYGSVIRENTDQ